jgi:nitrite reductase (NADH) large subunit
VGSALPDAAVVCSCENVTAGTLRDAIADGAADLTSLKACTRAGTGCGGCLPQATTILRSQLEQSGISLSRALCEHFEHSRQELFALVRVRRHDSFAAVLAAHGRPGAVEGCETCKPTVASILATIGTGHILDGDRAAIQDTNDFALANIQRNGTYSVVPRIPGGEITPAALIALGEVARDFGLYTKITGGQRIDLFGAPIEQLPAIWRRLVDAGFESGHAYGKALRTVKSCVGETWCRYGVQDSTTLAILLELRYRGLRTPHKVKMAVSGCARECAEAQSKDIGVIATERGWNLYVAGNGGKTPRHADLLATDLDTDGLLRLVDRFLMFYARTADRLERTSTWFENLDGAVPERLAWLREVLVDDALGICDELDADIAQHVATYECEWRATLEDPERLRRFVSFVNAPDEPDPTVRVTHERGQIRPAPLPSEVAVELR